VGGGGGGGGGGSFFGWGVGVAWRWFVVWWGGGGLLLWGGGVCFFVVVGGPPLLAGRGREESPQDHPARGGTKNEANASSRGSKKGKTEWGGADCSATNKEAKIKQQKRERKEKRRGKTDLICLFTQVL